MRTPRAQQWWIGGALVALLLAGLVAEQALRRSEPDAPSVRSAPELRAVSSPTPTSPGDPATNVSPELPPSLRVTQGRNLRIT